MNLEAFVLLSRFGVDTIVCSTRVLQHIHGFQVQTLDWQCLLASRMFLLHYLLRDATGKLFGTLVIGSTLFSLSPAASAVRARLSPPFAALN